MQNKQAQQNASARNMTGIYLGMEGSSPRFTHISAVPPLFRRRSFYRAKTSVEYQRYKKIEMLRLIESRQGFTDAIVKPNVKTVSPEVELHPHYHTKPRLLTAEELRKLTRKALRDFGIPGQSNGDKLDKRSKSSSLLNSPRKSPNSSCQSNIQDLSVVTNCGKTKEPYRISIAKQELTRTKPDHQEVCESAVPSQPERSSHNRQPRSSRAQHLPLKYLQSSQVFTRTEQLGRAAKIHLQSAGKDKMLLPSASVSGSPLLLPCKTTPLGRVHLAGRWGYTESGFPGYKTPRLNTALRCNLISKTLELKQRSDGNDSSKQVPPTATVNGTGVRNGSGRIDALKRLEIVQHEGETEKPPPKIFRHRWASGSQWWAFLMILPQELYTVTVIPGTPCLTQMWGPCRLQPVVTVLLCEFLQKILRHHLQGGPPLPGSRDCHCVKHPTHQCKTSSKLSQCIHTSELGTP
ncbi:uncharacterized protein LOC121272372 isoform X2 [Carcharodon carcharias]|uniref:uncharacterized protein LOC121272372 isoform X2 n=1 Tax=Carcharodon carcharias TaxID=13397 RepID=UPI001B7E9931|nr:uncharacterized protein LOC121272372 isoform X2 [Carcharodon carcharias]